VPKKKQPARPRPLYRKPPPKPEAGRQKSEVRPPASDIGHPHFLAPANFTLREDGSIETAKHANHAKPDSDSKFASSAYLAVNTPRLVFSSDHPFVRLYHGNCLELLDAIYAKHPEGRFDAIFADPPYFLSNGGITCHAGRMVKVDKGDWDISRGPELNHEFNLEWLRRCQRVLKPNGTLWVSGTHHVIFSIGYALQSLGFKILNDIAWEKPNPPPNLSCRYFTHSTETILWAAKNDKSKHVFNYQAMRKVTGKQMKTVWRDIAKQGMANGVLELGQKSPDARPQMPDPASDAPKTDSSLESIWTMTSPGNDEKRFGKHPTQKPVALVERCIAASTNEGDLVLDPFLGNGTTAVAALRLNRQCVGIELDLHNVQMAEKRVKAALEENTDPFTPPPPPHPKLNIHF